MVQERLPIAAAALHLGLSEHAVRKRIQRGTLTAEKDGAGKWLVLLDVDRDDPIATPQTSSKTMSKTVEDVVDEVLDTSQTQQDRPDAAIYRELVATLRSEVDHLRETLRTEREMREDAERRHAAEIERRDVLYREALARIPMLPAPGDRGDAPESPSDGPGRASEIHATPEPLGWGRRRGGDRRSRRRRPIGRGGGSGADSGVVAEAGAEGETVHTPS
jgi:hypothetical protein